MSRRRCLRLAAFPTDDRGHLTRGLEILEALDRGIERAHPLRRQDTPGAIVELFLEQRGGQGILARPAKWLVDLAGQHLAAPQRDSYFCAEMVLGGKLRR